jgi:peptide/nickel transport system substrate-binding protein
LTRQSRNFALFLAVATLVLLAGCRATPPSDSSASGNVVSPGGELVVSVRTDPQSFLWFTKRDGVTQLVTFLTTARLVRVDRATQNVEPWLAESWTRSADGRQYTVKLRPGVTFSDGHPFTADDVVFSFRAAYDEGSVIGDALQENGKRLTVTAPDATTVIIAFAEPFGPGLRILDNLPIVPRHKLEAALKAGTFARAWGVSTPPQDMAGLGPFVLTEYVPGQRMRFSRNARYFRKDVNGVALPYVDRVLVQVAPDQDTELLRLDAGQVDMSTSEIRPEDYAPLRRAADAGRVQIFDLGVGYDPDSLWFNLKPGALGSDPRAAWLQRDELRRAVSLAVNRQLFADTVYLGAATPAFGPITTANKPWYSPDVPHTPYDPARAKSLLASIGLTDRNGDGILEDARGEPARFTLLTQKGLSSLERGAAVIRDELKKIGLVVDVVPLEGNAVIQRFLSGRNYDAVYFRIATTDTDPAINLDFWLSSGTSHVWNLAQATPATPWERQIDELMTRQMTSSDAHERKRLFDEVQKVFAEYLPIIHFAAARVYVAASARVTHVTPAVLRPQLLWSPDTIAVRH